MSKPFAWAYIHAGTLVTLWHNNTGGVRSPPVTIADDIHALIRQSVHNNEPPFHLTETIKQISHPWGYSMQEQPDWEHIFDHTAFLRHRFYQCTFMIANTGDCQAFESATSESSSASTELSDIVLSARLLVCPPQLSTGMLQNNLPEFKHNHLLQSHIGHCRVTKVSCIGKNQCNKNTPKQKGTSKNLNKIRRMSSVH